MGRVSDYPFRPLIDLSDPEVMRERVRACGVARAGSWFWLPCPLCGLEFGGHEKMRGSADAPSSVYLGGDLRVSQSICPYCTMAGRGADPRWNADDALRRAYGLTERPVADVVREAGFGPVPERIRVTCIQDPPAVLRWHYGPTATDPDPGSMWCYDCGSEVWTLEGGYICRGCGRQADE